MLFGPLEEIIEDIRAGKMVIVGFQQEVLQ